MTLLDPGEYGFSGPSHQDLIVSKEDAEFIDVIHTDALAYGFLKPLGHVDYYPNGGISQPCSCDHPCEEVECQWGDHGRAPAYFAESIRSSEKFPSWKCDISWEEFLVTGSCPYLDNTPLSRMGEWSLDARSPNSPGGVPEQGFYFLRTKGVSPFSCAVEECN